MNIKMKEEVYKLAAKYDKKIIADDSGLMLITDSVGCHFLVELAELRKRYCAYVCCSTHHLYPNKIAVSIA